MLVVVPAWGASDSTVYLASTPWPPYSGASQPDGGATTELIREAFAAVGRKVVVNFYPWRRTMFMARQDPQTDGFYPAYYNSARAQEFLVSAPIAVSLVGFAERRDAPVTWQSLSDLAPYRLAVVDGYYNPGGLDAMIAHGVIKTDTVRDDALALGILGAGRVRLAVVGRNVMNYLLRTDPMLRRYRTSIDFNPHVLATLTVHLMFRKTARGQRLQQDFARGLHLIDQRAIMKRYIPGYLTELPVPPTAR